jgi:glycerol uptake facilitator-like aquaporin
MIADKLKMVGAGFFLIAIISGISLGLSNKSSTNTTSSASTLATATVPEDEESLAKKYWWVIVLVSILAAILLVLGILYSLRMRNQPMGELR